MPSRKIVVGLTGAFGSGFTTAAKHLRDSRKFELLTMSDVLRSILSAAASWQVESSSGGRPPFLLLNQPDKQK
jgi:dephospho-CoA kinase